MEPEEVTFELLEAITNCFSEYQKLGEGAFGAVYKGVTKNGDVVAVKKLHNGNQNLDDKQFQNEFNNLAMLTHRNIVQILGYCYETKKTPRKFDGRTVLTEEIHRALCFEYLPNGTLEKHLTGEFYGFDWHTRYNIIKGVCEGLYYLHKGSDKPIYHLDLKPENILLDNDLVPKIADLGLSMISSTEKTRTIPNSLGTLGYRPKEHIDTGEISDKFDIFSLGVVMIKIISGTKGYFECAEMNKDEFIDRVNKNWKDRLQATCCGSLLEVYCNQVQICTEIALDCVEDASQNRPDIVKIIDKLNETETDIGKLPDKRCSEIASKITMHNEIPAQMQHFNQTTSARSNISARSNELEGIPDTSTDIGEKYIVGRTDEKQKIIGSLLQCRPRTITILPIYGIGGIGKTTLAKLIYNEFNNFYRVWVYVSQTFDLIEIRNSIVTQLSGKDSKNKERQDIDNCLKDILSGMKILIVLDDLWEHNVFQLNNLKDMLCAVGGNNTLCVLVTTRDEYIADKICMNHEPHKIKSLTEEVCWDIIKHRSCFEARHDKEHLTGIGMEIARKCRGVALVAQSLGSILQSMTSDQWTKVRDNDIWNVAEDASSPNNVLPSLKLSYDNMTQSLKSCFSYCATFPKGCKIAPDDLIYQWISLGFIKPTRLLSPKQLCEKYIMQLQGLSFLEKSKVSGSIFCDDHILTRVSMHDVVHDLARSVKVDEILDATKECQNQGYSYFYGSLPLTDCGKALELSTTSLTKIKAMHLLHYDRIETCDAAFSSAKSLRVLDTSKCQRRLPLSDSISKLKQLRYLNARNIRQVPCFKKFSKLIYLKLPGVLITALPQSIGALKDLMYLDISRNLRIRKLPESFMNLKRLVHLNLSLCISLTVKSKTLVGLKNIEYLNLSRISRLGYNSTTDIKEVIANLTELKYLDLGGLLPTSGDEALDLIDCICTLSNLEHLDLSANHGIVKLPESIDKLRKLRTLKLNYCKNLVKLPECMAKMDSLVLSFEEIFDLPEFIVQEDGDASSSNIGFLKFVNRSNLHIHRLDNVKSTEEVRGIELVKKQWMEDLELKWTTDARRSVEDMEVLGELVPPSTLREFKIKGYSSVRLPAWVMGIASFLPILKGITVEDLPKCCILPPLGLLPNLKKLVIAAMDSITTIEEGFYGCARAFPQLKIFELHNMKNLEGWSIMHPYSHDGVKEFMFPKLVELEISDCPKLILLSCLPRARKWKIQNSDSLLSTCGNVKETCSSCSSELIFSEVTVKYSKVPLDRWRLLHHIPGISELRIQCCTDLACSSPEIVQELGVWTCPRLSDLQQESMQCLTSLHKLYLEDCPSITELPESLGDLTSLKNLTVTGCPGVKCLPVSIRKLAKLDTLHVSHCPALEELESLGDLTSLKNLTITECSGVKCLPVSIRKLAKIRFTLEVARCP